MFAPFKPLSSDGELSALTNKGMPQHFYRAVLSNASGSRTILRSPLFIDGTVEDEAGKAKEKLRSQIELHKKMGYSVLTITKELRK